MTKIFDSHAHYDDDAFSEDRKELLLSLKDNGVARVVNVGATVASSYKSMELSMEYDFIYSAIGVHPSEIKELTIKDLDFIKEIHDKCPKMVAVGEIGLDYYWDKDNKDAQKEFFAAQIQIAKELKQPIIVHSRDAAADTYELMKSEKAEDCGGVIHCFSYSKEEAMKYLDMGFCLGIGGVLTFKNAAKIKEVAQIAPLDRILIETDCPYLAPVPHRGERNCSIYLHEVVKALSEIKGVDAERIIQITYDNANRLYRIKE